MAGRIRGITAPIGGDTTKLQTALKLAEITGFNLTFDMIAPSHGAIWRENMRCKNDCPVAVCKCG